MPFERCVENVKKAGFNGVEMALPNDDACVKKRILDVLNDSALLFVGRHSETVVADS